MSRHTPGPWTIQADKGRTFSDESVDHGGYRIDADHVEQLAYVWNFSDRFDPTTGQQDGTRPFGSHEAEANACLIAAAPELLEALSNAEEFVNRHSEPWYMSGQALLSHIRSAISKATGDQP